MPSTPLITGRTPKSSPRVTSRNLSNPKYQLEKQSLSAGLPRRDEGDDENRLRPGMR